MKAARYAMILDLIETFNIETQDDLAMRLKEDVYKRQASPRLKTLRLQLHLNW